MLTGVLPAGAVFPFDFGFVPSTLGDDGDPLDILVLMDAPAFAGCIVPSRLDRRDSGRANGGRKDRAERPAAGGRRELDHPQVDTEACRREPDLVGQIEHFFVSYNQVKGKKFVPIRRVGPDAAEKLVAAGMKRKKR